jgi:hypothetical protein
MPVSRRAPRDITSGAVSLSEYRRSSRREAIETRRTIPTTIPPRNATPIETPATTVFKTASERCRRCNPSASERLPRYPLRPQTNLVTVRVVAGEDAKALPFRPLELAHARPHDASAYPLDVLADDGLALIEHLGLTDYDLGGHNATARALAEALPNGRYTELPGNHATAMTSPEFEKALTGFLAELRARAVSRP